MIDKSQSLQNPVFSQAILESQAMVFVSALACRTHARPRYGVTTPPFLRNE